LEDGILIQSVRPLEGFQGNVEFTGNAPEIIAPLNLIDLIGPHHGPDQEER